MTSKARTLTSTYRFQCHREFPFRDVEQIVPYLKDLGISHVYLSPILQAVSGSQHGYDVVDPSTVNPECGGLEGFRALAATCHKFGLGIVVDIVPNHMATGEANWWWQDVLAAGQSSPYSCYFDIYWQDTPAQDTASNSAAKGAPSVPVGDQVMLAVLGQPYGRVLADRELKLVSDDGFFKIAYYDHRFPVNLDSIVKVLQGVAVGLQGDQNADKFRKALKSLETHASKTPNHQEGRHLAYKERTSALSELASLISSDQTLSVSVTNVLATINSDLDKLHSIIAAQHYRLSYWRTGADRLNYRRFFDVTSLIGLRTEVPEVFEAVHNTIFQLVDEGCIDGLRVDHPDGLANPREYFCRLRQRLPDTWIVAEKILEGAEQIPSSWPIAGTTGYDLMSHVNQVLTNPAGEISLTQLYSKVTGTKETYGELLRINKARVIEELLYSDLDKLTRLIEAVAARGLRYRDFSHRSIKTAIVALVTEVPTYRTYIEPSETLTQQVSVKRTTNQVALQISESDQVLIRKAVAAAKANNPSLDSLVLDFLHSLLTGQVDVETVDPNLVVESITRLQQLSGPAMAKGAEDTTFYQYHRLISLNEVGGDPGHFGLDLQAFHRTMAARAKDWPMAMSASSTHDTKRSEDVRLRIASIADRPEEWIRLQKLWQEIGEEFKQNGYPEPATEYLVHQIVFGVPKITKDRLAAYLIKAMRETKGTTSWLAPNEDYEAKVTSYASQFLGSKALQDSLRSDSLLEWEKLGYEKALAAKVLTLTLPGIPDIYQGTEIWDDSLVDPDNRRAVDFAVRTALLKDLDRVKPSQLAMSDDRLKLWWTKTILSLRRHYSEAFAGAYTGLTNSGPYLGYLRGEDVIVFVKRWPLSNQDNPSRESDRLVFPESLKGTQWSDVSQDARYSSNELDPTALLATAPVAILTRT